MRLFLFQIVFHELAVAAGILLILVIRDDASGFPCCLHYICRISTVLFPGFLPVCGIRVSRVLEYGCIHPSVFFCAQAQGAVLILYGLLLQHAQKQLVAAGFIISAFAQFFQGDSILQDDSNLFGGFLTAVMVDNTVAVICLRVVFQPLRQFLLTCRRFFYKVTSTNILLFSQKVENQRTKLNKIVIPNNLSVSYENFDAYKVDKKVLESLLDEESHMIHTNYIDEVSSITNSELDELLTMEIDNDL